MSFVFLKYHIMSNPNDLLLEEIMKQCPESLRDELEVELIRRRNEMHDNGVKDFAISMHNCEFAGGAMFAYRLQADKLIEVVPPEGTTIFEDNMKYHIQRAKSGGIVITKHNAVGSLPMEITIQVIMRNQITIL
jgi:hypothetical protein